MKKLNNKNVEDFGFIDNGKELVPPHAEFSERYVLGVCMVVKEAFDKVKDLLKPDMFYDPRLQIVFKAIINLTNSSKPVDIITVADTITKAGDMELIGGPKFITDISSKVSSTSYLQYHAKLIKQKYLARELITLCRYTKDLVENDQVDIDELVEETEKRLFNLSQPNSFVQAIAPLAKEIDTMFIKKLSKISYTSDGFYLSTGYPKLDKIIVGYGKSELIIVAGRPAMGKTSFIASSAVKLAKDFHIPVLIFSVEKSAKQLTNLLVSNVCAIPSEKLRSGEMEFYEYGQGNCLIKGLYDAPLFIDDTVGPTVQNIWRTARRMIREHGIKIIFIDYLQLIKGSKNGYVNRYEEVSDTIISLKKIARDLDIPIVLTSQLSRRADEKKDFLALKPKLENLRDSGMIEEVADKVLLLYRPSFYEIAQDNKGKDMQGVLDVIVAKNHDGKEGETNLRFRGEFQSVQPLDDDTIVEGNLSITGQENKTIPPAGPVPF